MKCPKCRKGEIFIDVSGWLWITTTWHCTKCDLFVRYKGFRELLNK